ncbi:hypothetical protein [Actinomyces ruminicola]|uniref:Uncharacterized protein n=1 Tax=Actinomyces ruminicola TaxID=332524 RepID=A0A1G9SWY8_9ACTO|nr:hypothetical protein [Actinomyces ruminicola]SDM39959.1 hypothetical protein SAMN04487766_102127 [Actinomyces ruminicola]
MSKEADMSDSVDVVCKRGRWHRKPVTLATFVREDDPVRADYWEPDDVGLGGHGWRAVRKGGLVDPYRDRNAPMSARLEALRESPPVAFGAVGAGTGCLRCDWLNHRAAGYDWPEPEGEGHGPDCARWSAVCRCGWPTWNVPVRLMVPLLERAADAGRDLQAEEVEAVAAGYPGTTWLDDRAPFGGEGAPDVRALKEYLNVVDRGEARSAQERLGYLAPGTRGLIPDGIALMVEAGEHRAYGRARVAVLIARRPWLDVRGEGNVLDLNDYWVAVDGVERAGGGYRFVADPADRVFEPQELVDMCEQLYGKGCRSVLLDAILRVMNAR